MKEDRQILAYRIRDEANQAKMVQKAKDKDRALAHTGHTDFLPASNGDANLDDEDAGESNGLDPSKIIVIHPGSQNLRIGLASDALPKTIPMAVAVQTLKNESEVYGERPKRQQDSTPDQQFGQEFSRKFKKMSEDLKVDMRAKKYKVLPNSKEMVVNFNRRQAPDEISELNDKLRIEWTDISEAKETDCFVGMKALRIPDDSTPRFQVLYPLQSGVFNENANDYTSAQMLYGDFGTIIEEALEDELGLSRPQWKEYHCVVVIPDLYDKRYVDEITCQCLNFWKFKLVAVIQESYAATFGAGYSSACVVDIGAQKTSMACVEEGLVIEDSRINLKYGGHDVTEAFIKMMLFDHFPYADINLKRRYDFFLAEELKIKLCTLDLAHISVQASNFHLRAPNQPTRKYEFKYYDEAILASMGFCDPSIFDHSDKLVNRRTFIDRSYNAYDVDIPDDPTSKAQDAILISIKPSLASTLSGSSNDNIPVDISTPSKEKSSFLSRMDSEANGTSRVTSAAGSPAPEGSNTPFGANGGSPGPSGGMFQFGAGSHNSGTPGPAGMFVDHNRSLRTPKHIAEERDSVLPIAPLDTAIITCITHAAKNDEKKIRDFFGGIMLVGGGAKTPGFQAYLEAKLKARRPDLADKILVGYNPKDMDSQIVVWSGACVFAKMRHHEAWISQEEYERLGSRMLYTKNIWQY